MVLVVDDTGGVEHCIASTRISMSMLFAVLSLAPAVDITAVTIPPIQVVDRSRERSLIGRRLLTDCTMHLFAVLNFAKPLSTCIVRSSHFLGFQNSD